MRLSSPAASTCLPLRKTRTCSAPFIETSSDKKCSVQREHDIGHALDALFLESLIKQPLG